MRGVRLIEFAVWAGPFTARRPQEASAPPRRTAKAASPTSRRVPRRLQGVFV